MSNMAKKEKTMSHGTTRKNFSSAVFASAFFAASARIITIAIITIIIS